MHTTFHSEPTEHNNPYYHNPYSQIAPPPPKRPHWLHIMLVTSLVWMLIGIVAGIAVYTAYMPTSGVVYLTKTNTKIARVYGSIAQQDVTATVSAGGALNHFAYGQCTYYASMRYHQLTGQWVPWLGNAYQWAYEAPGFGWRVSPTPRAPSIIVLQPGVEGAGRLGQVAIVESINPDGSVTTSTWGWYGPSGAGWGRLSVVTFRPGPGISFVWHP